MTGKTKRKTVAPTRDGGHADDLYLKIPCTVGLNYARIEVDGTVKPCCIARHGIGNLNTSSWSEIWHGAQAQRFREKTGKIHEEGFHLTDPEWGFCRQCSHRRINTDNARALGYEVEDE